jgi:Leucine-rich repeat (LRR) protein
VFEVAQGSKHVKAHNIRDTQLTSYSLLLLLHHCCCYVWGTAGLTSLRELALDGNRLTSLAPLAALSGLEVLLAAHNHLSSCEGVQVRHLSWYFLVRFF